MREKSSSGTFEKRRTLFPLVLAVVCLAWLSANASSQETAEYKLRVAVKSAAAHSGPDAQSPVIARIPEGTLLASSHADGVWFRIVVPTGKEGIILIGYVSRLEVEILEENVRKPADFWGTTPDEYRGIGLGIKLGAGFCFFSGGDIDGGASGMFDQGIEDLAASKKNTMGKKDPRAFSSGLEAGADIYYRLSPKLGIGIGGSYYAAKAKKSQPFTEYAVYDQQFLITPEAKVVMLKLNLTYELPLLSWLAARAEAGPAYFSVKYTLGQNSSTMALRETYEQSAKANGIGAHGSLGLTFRINSQTVFILEARGRYARFPDLKGSEKWVRSQPGGFVDIDEASGSLYYIEGARYPKLAVLADGAAGAGARKAVFDFSGVSLAGGIMLRF